MSLQQQIIAELGVQPTIDPEAEIRKRVDFLKQYVLGSGTNGLLIAISGGVDSAVATGLCKRATDELTEETGKEYITLGVFQPYGEQSDIEHSYATAKAFGLTHTVETNIQDAVDHAAAVVDKSLEKLDANNPLKMTDKGKGNIKARTRMVVQYALSFEMNLLVVGTDHASEAITGFYTKWGDGAVDVTPLSTLNKRQVRLVAAALGVPADIVTKAPTAGLWAGQTDENELGITYDENSDYLEGKEISSDAQSRLENYYKKTGHKRDPIPGI